MLVGEWIERKRQLHGAHGAASAHQFERLEAKDSSAKRDLETKFAMRMGRLRRI